ncbi:MAG: DUF1810 family protein [Roseiflexaceae bacterium]
MTPHTDALERFVTAQNKSFEGYASALAELRAGRKQSHWIWYIFPKLRPGDPAVASEYTQYYGLSDDTEALAYLQHPVLGPRLAEITAVVHTQLIERNIHPEVLLMWDKDVKKVRSCMKLFLRVAAKADTHALPWLAPFMAHAQTIFDHIDKPAYRGH